MLQLDQLQAFIASAIAEDVGSGDYSSLACIPETAHGNAQLLIKEHGILAGVDVASHIFRFVEPDIQIDYQCEDGQEVKPGMVAFRVSGRVQSMLKAERLVLNCMQRMSGIATLTQTYVQLLHGTSCRLLDTRKTTPNFRLLEKEAVRIGGGCNHRMGLYDMIMLKDNHIDYAGGIRQALSRVQAYLKHHHMNLPVEIEIRTLEDLEEVLKYGGVTRIMFDNFTVPDVAEGVKRIQGAYETEASGGITLDTIRHYAQTGVDFVSTGAITHHAVSLDLSLKATAAPSLA